MLPETAHPKVSDLHSREVTEARESSGTQLIGAGRLAVDLDPELISSDGHGFTSTRPYYYGRHVEDKLVDDYLGRIGCPPVNRADAETLRSLHRAHQMSVPFENLSIHMAEPISLAEADLLAKIVARRRGGFCYELNGAFALLLTAIGFEVERTAARVYGGGTLGPPFDHMALVVRPSDGSGPWLADVGFGSHSTYPLLLEDGAEQHDPAGLFQVVPAADGDLEVLKGSEPQYRLERRARSLEDFVPTCWWQQTAPQSHFRAGLICSLLTGDGRISLSGRTLITTSDGSRTEDELTDDAAVLAAYRDHFGIVLDRVPGLVTSQDRR
jgi:N-hydroxyarylamine O-acetyltransferase